MPQTRVALGALSGNARPAGRAKSGKRKPNPEDQTSCPDQSKRPKLSGGPQSSSRDAPDTHVPEADVPIAITTCPASPAENGSPLGDGGEIALAVKLPAKSSTDGRAQRMEIWTGSGENHGAIKFFPESGSQPELVIPFSDIEQILIRLNDKKHYTSLARAYRVVLVRKTDIGSSALINLRPKGGRVDDVVKHQAGHAITFHWPDKKINKALTCATAEKGEDTYLSALKRVLNRQLQPLGKSVFRITLRESIYSDDSMFSCTATLKQLERTDIRSPAEGHLYFLSSGLAFATVHFNYYLPLRAIESGTLVVAKERDQAVGLTLCCHTTDAAWPDKDTWEWGFQSYEVKGGKLVPRVLGPIMAPILAFNFIGLEFQQVIRGCFDRVGLPLKAHQQHFYNYEKQQPMTGWEPLKD